MYLVPFLDIEGFGAFSGWVFSRCGFRSGLSSTLVGGAGLLLCGFCFVFGLGVYVLFLMPLVLGLVL